MSESGDYTPAAHWSGHNFVSAKRAYRDVADRSLTEAKAKNIDPKDLFPKKLSTNSEAPLVIGFDVTASMDDWPVTICSKLPYLEYEGQEYLGDGMEISWCAFGDSKYDRYPFQARGFCKGKKLKTELDKLVHERGGGGNQTESYDLAARYYANNCEMPEAIRKPIFIFICDEGIYDSPNAADWTSTEGVDGDWKDHFNALCQKFSVYCIRKQYHGNEKEVRSQWGEAIGEDRVIQLQDANRVVDVIFGLLANETGRIEYFEDELRERQGKDKDGDDKIEKVLVSLHSIHGERKSVKKLAGPKGGGKSKSVAVKGKAPKGGKAKSISLLDDE